ncbi:hypothetical protein FA15DRAFT_652681 [Coprinopsis marcescibilis]|uniref:Uncharacterized protein n=1 Tax=Coprinopsis marcescibilis TaxID=230819 RepID=A0A5C3L9I3_COPMA|nr:hypothetical protein FA15DRAFT_652681 [Coprinopsis marcescibilis]
MPKETSKPVTDIKSVSALRLSDRERRPTRKVLGALSDNAAMVEVRSSALIAGNTEVNTSSRGKQCASPSRLTSCNLVASTHGNSENGNDLQGKICLLEASERRLKKKLLSKGEEIGDLKAALQAAKHESEEMEQRIDEAEEATEAINKEKKRALEALKREKEQYRKWWLNEIQFTKLLLSMDSTPQRDQDVVREIRRHYHD